MGSLKKKRDYGIWKLALKGYKTTGINRILSGYLGQKLMGYGMLRPPLMGSHERPAISSKGCHLATESCAIESFKFWLRYYCLKQTFLIVSVTVFFLNYLLCIF